MRTVWQQRSMLRFRIFYSTSAALGLSCTSPVERPIKTPPACALTSWTSPSPRWGWRGPRTGIDWPKINLFSTPHPHHPPPPPSDAPETSVHARLWNSTFCSHSHDDDDAD